jgi:ABC-type phosphate/phosphonate transport system permease subunit
VRFTYLVEVEVERTEGKFASREEVEEQITDALESADPGSVDGIGADGDSSYEVTSWDVQPQEQPKRKRGSH